MRQLIRRVWYTIQQRQLEADLAEEMEFHRTLEQGEIEKGWCGSRPGHVRHAAFARKHRPGPAVLMMCGVRFGFKVADWIFGSLFGRSWPRGSCQPSPY